MYNKNTMWETYEYWSGILEKIPRSRLVEMADELNHGGWPKELGIAPEDTAERNEARKDVMAWIEVECGNKALLRYHHLHNLLRTEQEFEDWWDEQSAWWLWGEGARDDFQALVIDAVIAAISSRRKLLEGALFVLGITIGVALGVLL